MSNEENLMLITQIVSKEPRIGKTAIMKITYLLQTLYGVPLDYHYEIYTYGPYCQSVMSDIEYAEARNLIKIEQVWYSSGAFGYEIEATENGKHMIGLKESQDYSSQVDSVLSFFGHKTAKELELYSTIIFVFSSCRANSWDCSRRNICNTVHSIKPHFSLDCIGDAFDELSAHDFLN